jgi:hypothetical protein
MVKKLKKVNKPVLVYIDEDTYQKLNNSLERFVKNNSEKDGKWQDYYSINKFKTTDYLRYIVMKYLKEEEKNESKV